MGHLGSFVELASIGNEARGHQGNRGRRPAHGIASICRHGSARTAARSNTNISRDIPFHYFCRKSGSAFRRERSLAICNRGRADGALHRLDEIGLLDLDDISPLDRGPRGVHIGWTSCRRTDYRALSRRPRRAAVGTCVRARYRHRKASAARRIETKTRCERRATKKDSRIRMRSCQRATE